MDLIRASVKALFYDYPVDTAIQIVTTGHPFLTGEFARLVNARERCYTQASVEALRLKLCNEWMGGEIPIDGADEMYMSLKLPSLYASKALDNRKNVPTVDFEQLFRWSELVRYVGEDLLTVNYLAKRDVERGIERDYYEWDAVLPHNEVTLNKVIGEGRKGLCDIHLHLDATTDVFELSWVSLMNHIQGRKEYFSKLMHPLDSPILVTKTYNYEDLYRWCILASKIRWELFKRYTTPETDTFGKVFDDGFVRFSSQMPMYFIDELRNLQCLITDAGKMSFKTSDGVVYDYAIVEDKVGDRYKNSPFMIYHGERWLLYQYYNEYWQNKPESVKIGKYVYLYELIKNQLRRELVQVNDFPGLGNFQEYNRRKSWMVKESIKTIGKRYAVQTTITNDGDGMEARICSMDVVDKYKKILNFDYHKYLFGQGYFTTNNDLKDRLTFVVLFSKEKCCENNIHGKQRENNRLKAEALMKIIKNKDKQKDLPLRIVGIDAAGGETNCRPEVFAHLFRYCRKMGVSNFTYHVGEDFYDITDGLRSIDESIRYLHLTEGNRLGHCIALGIDAKKYYSQRHRVVIMPKQLLLDNIVWLLCYCENHHIGLLGLRAELETYSEMLYKEIGYEPPYNMMTYHKSMLLRGDDFVKYQKASSTWFTTAKDNTLEVLAAGEDKEAQLLYHQYYKDSTVYKNGFCQSTDFKIPYQYERVIKKVQNKMIKLLSFKKIYIETTPTSNVRIGCLAQYDDLPLFRFSKIRKQPGQDIHITVNTDDKGIFGTSLYRELSLLALALSKQRYRGDVKKWDKQLIYHYIERLANEGQTQRFKS